MNLLAIDPGNTHSGVVIVDTDTYKPILAKKLPNVTVLELLDEHADTSDTRFCFIEQIGHYGTGMAAGTTVFDTCRWIGRFEQMWWYYKGTDATLVKRATIKTHLTGQARAKDGNVAQALIDRFAPDTPNRGKGSKAEPGFFYGFKADIWQAYALAVYAIDTLKMGRFL